MALPQPVSLWWPDHTLAIT